MDMAKRPARVRGHLVERDLHGVLDVRGLVRGDGNGLEQFHAALGVGQFAGEARDGSFGGNASLTLELKESLLSDRFRNDIWIRRQHASGQTKRFVSRPMPALSRKKDIASGTIWRHRGFPHLKNRENTCFFDPKHWLARVLPVCGTVNIVNRKRLAHSLGMVGAVSMLALWNTPANANGIYRDGVGARSMAMGGADVAWAEDPLGALGVNPAGLGFQSSAGLNLGLFGGSANGEFEKTAPTTSNGSLDQTLNVLPEGAFAIPIGKLPVTVGLAVVPDALMSANWHYIDPPSTPGNVSYGYQGDKSVIGVLRTALGVGVALGDKWSVGGSLGVLYNQNELITPYIFQTQPTLKGAKTLLDLNTSGWGVNGQFGVIYRPIDTLQFGLVYTTSSTIYSKGDASGNVAAQFGSPVPIPFHYDAEVDNTFPQMVSGGGSWKFYPGWRATLQVDWIDWAGAFTTLPVKLSNGNNATVNTIVGSSSLNDSVPLNWKDEFVFRGGLEYAITTNVTLRGGYSYGHSPVPSETLTPLTAAITQGAVSAGIGCHWSRYQIDLAYEYDLPTEQSIGTSSLQAGEYSNSTIKVAIQWIGLTAGIKF
jgi:long-chain fatty acid transport protein